MTALPQFPLTMVVFPSEEIHLHIFEYRYLKLVREAADQNIHFGIVPFINGQVAEFGTEVSLKQIDKRFQDGKLNITCIGLRPYRIVEFHSVPADEGYAMANVQFVHSDETSSLTLRKRMKRTLDDLIDQIGGNLSLDLNELTLHTAQFIHKLGFELEKEYEVFCLFSETKRLNVLDDHLSNYIPELVKANEIRKRIKANGHFRSFDPLDL